MSPRRDPIAGQRREREQERREGEMGNEGRETAGKGGRGGDENGRGVLPASAPIHQYLQNNFKL